MNIVLMTVILLSTFTANFNRVPQDCPAGYQSVAKWEVSRWEPGIGFETGFEFGSEYIAIDLVGGDNEGEINRLVFVVLKGPITHAVVKNGASLTVYDYTDNPLVPTPTIPPETYEIFSSGNNSLSHVTWCSLEPTSITLSSVYATSNDILLVLALAIFGVIVCSILLVLLIAKRMAG